ncbi:MAG: DUF3536 domain-containing protein, partial [Polyangia bacterium]
SWSCHHGVGRWWRDCGCTMVPTDNGWNHRWRTPLRQAMDRLQLAAADFYEDAAASLLIDPWGARDAYGEVVDAPAAARDALLAEFATPELSAGGEGARARARLLLEMQRATLLMYASCGWYFDDIAGLEASLILRFAAHAADLMNAAGGVAPIDDVLDLLAGAKSNQPGGETGADVFRRGAADRATPRRAVAAVAMALGAEPVTSGLAARGQSLPSPKRPEPTRLLRYSSVKYVEYSPSSRLAAGPAAPISARSDFIHGLLGRLTPGYEVEILSQASSKDAGGALELSGQARVAADRLGSTESFTFEARWEVGGAVRLLVGDEEVQVSQLGRESRYRALPLLLPRILEASKDAPLASARLALDLGADVVGDGNFLEDTTLRSGYAQLLVRLLESRAAFAAPHLEVALQLLKAAGGELAPGAAQRVLVEELVAERRTTSLDDRATRGTTAKGAAWERSQSALQTLAARLNFVVPGDDVDQTARSGDAGDAGGQGRRAADGDARNGTSGSRPPAG